MRKQRYYSFVALLVGLFLSCTEKEPSIPTPKLMFSEETDAGFDSITLSCAVSGNVSAERLIIEYSKDKSLASVQKKSLEKSGDSFTITITGLDIQTTYYYRYTVENKASVYTEDNIRQFKTLDYVVPEVTTVGVRDVSGTTATLEGKVDFACSKPILEQGFRISKDKDNYEVREADLGSFSLKVDGLEFETTYYYQAYAKTEIGIGYGEVKELKTCNAVSFKPVEVKNITATSAVVSGGVEDNGGIAIDSQGFRYSDGTSGDYTFVESTGEATLSNLKSDTSYRVWYYAKTIDGEFEGKKLEFSTSDGNISFGACLLTGKTADSITLSTTINGDGGGEIIRRGFVYDSKPAPTLEDYHILVSGTIGNMVGTISELTNNTVYHIRAFAENEVGVQYGSEVDISTMSGIAEMSETEVSEISADSAKLTSDIVSSNGTSVLSCGFCYNLSGTPTTSDMVIESSSVSESMSVLVNQLKVNTKYYVRSFAKTKYGTSYGPENNFKTKDGVVVFTNLSISEVNPESATANVTIFDNGGCPIDERGFCYSTEENPTVSSKTATSSSAESTYSSVLSSLSRSTKYYYRAYAKNRTGIFYSVQDVFTSTSGLATLGALSATTVESTLATLSCEVTSDGGATVSERGFCYATTPTPTVSSSKNAVSGTVGSMQGDITGLEPDTKYYVRAYATTQYGTVYSNEVQITTKLGLPKLYPVSVSDIQPTSATFSSEIAEDGDGYILEKGFCYSTSANPGKDDTIVYVNSNWDVTVTGLKQNTSYYVRSFATTQYGTAYSEQTSFTTTYNPVEFENISVLDIGITNLIVSCSVSDYGGNTIYDEGFCVSTSTNPTTFDSKYGNLGSKPSMIITSLNKDTKYYIRRYVINEVGTFYSDEVSANTYDVPDNSVLGVFSVSSSKKVVFSKSNMQHISATEIGFMPNQYSIYGESNMGRIYPTTPADLFHYTYVQSSTQQYPYNDDAAPAYSALGTGWSTLTVEEWTYLMENRANASSLVFYNVNIGGNNGVLLLPDIWPGSYLTIANNATISVQDFNTLEENGAVFIPYTGYIGLSVMSYYPYTKTYSIHKIGEEVIVLAYVDCLSSIGPGSIWNYCSFIKFKADGYVVDTVQNTSVGFDRAAVRLVHEL